MANSQSARQRTRWNVASVLGVMGGVIVGLVVLAFLWPVATSSPKDLPVAVTGPDQSVDAAEAAIQQADGPLALEEITDRAGAVRAIEQRDVYGALVLGDEPEMLVASGASSVSVQILRGVAGELSQPDAPVTVTDVVPFSADDPNGAGLTAASFPLVLGGLIGGVLISLLVVGAERRLAALVVYGVVAGLAVALVMHSWFGIVQGHFWLDVLALSLAMVATSSVVVGFNALLGPPGIGVAAVLTMFVANPISGAAQPPEFIAGPFGEIGQFFVPGAGSSLIRQISYFPDASSTREWLVLAAWAVTGLGLSAVGHARNRSMIDLPESELEHRGQHAAVKA